MVVGNTDGIKRALLWALEKHIGFTDKTSFVSEETLALITDFTQKTGREVSVFISRAGRVEGISVGDSNTAPAIQSGHRRGENSSQKVRCVHTHPNGVAKLSNVDLSCLMSCKYDCIAAVGVSNKGAKAMQVAYLANGKPTLVNVELDEIDHEELLEKIKDYDSVGKERTVQAKEEINKRCLTVGVGDEESLYELKRLAETAGFEPVGKVMQRRQKPDSATYVGSGKIEEIALQVQVLNIGTVIFDVALNGLQQMCISEKLGCNVMDRGNLILTIFEKHATTAEGRLQVKLARLKYMLPLLVGQGESMSRQRGGLYALGGSGETKLEVDRRHIRAQISDISEKLKNLANGRDLRRKKRRQTGIKSVTLLGYTNAGKSTLMNAISRADVYAENKLFATLDSVSRNVWTEAGSYVLTDTVGFIRNLPHTFVEAFKSTLDEVRYADLLLHVVDASSPEMQAQIDTVNSVIEEIGASNVPIITVYNKVDKAGDLSDDAIKISAKFGDGVSELKEIIRTKLFGEKKDDCEC